MNDRGPMRPRKVNQALILLYVGLSIGVARMLFQAWRQAHVAPLGIGLVHMAAVLAVMWSLIYLIGKGRNWARITYLLVFVVPIPIALPDLLPVFRWSPWLASALLAQLVVQTVAVVFLFQKPSSEWFRQMRSTKPPRDTTRPGTS